MNQILAFDFDFFFFSFFCACDCCCRVYFSFVRTQLPQVSRWFCSTAINVFSRLILRVLNKSSNMFIITTTVPYLMETFKFCTLRKLSYTVKIPAFGNLNLAHDSVSLQ